MKRLIAITILCGLPLSTLAQVDTAVNRNLLINRPSLDTEEGQAARAELIEKHLQERRLNANRNTDLIDEAVNTDTNIAAPHHMLPVKRARLEELRQQKPKDPKEAIEVHEDVLTERIEEVESNESIPEEKKEQILERFNDELIWVQTKKTELIEAASSEEEQVIREEIIEHVRSVQTERKQQLAATVQLPRQSPTKLATQISDRFTVIAERLAANGSDTTALNDAIAQYDAAVAELDSSYAAVQANKTVETLQNLRDRIKAVRDAGIAVRNSVQSIVKN